MQFTAGNKYVTTVFGESHGEALGCVIEGIEAGQTLDFEKINSFLRRRAPGKNKLETQRKEKDEYKIISGIFENKTTGAPITAIFENKDINDKDYEKLRFTPRPGHGDLTHYVKYNAFNDYRGGGVSSGRITLPICFSGAVAMQLLEQKGIKIISHIYSIGDIFDDKFDLVNPNINYENNDFPVCNFDKSIEMKQKIRKCAENGDSVGGIIECAVMNVPTGAGGELFASVESVISKYIFSIPGVKGIEFGSGFGGTLLYGSENNDELYYDDVNVKAFTNNCGGVLGGLASGMPIVFRVAMKPTPSIAKEQKTVNLKTKENCVIKVTGRHDPSIVLRAVPCVEAAAALAIKEFV